jgi:nitrite reductase (NADH) small subunit
VAAEARSAIDVGAIDDFPERAMRIVSAGRQQLGILRWPDGRVFALRNHCPHQGGPVCEGAVALTLSPWDRRQAVGVERDRPVIICGWHHWEFDVASGRALSDSRLRVRTYPVRVEEGRVLVEGLRA